MTAHDRRFETDATLDIDVASEITVREADPGDIPAIRQIERACFSNPWPHDAFERYLDESGFLVADRGGEVLGHVVADVTPNFGRDIGHIKDLAVAPAARRSGLGRLLLRSALVRLQAQDAAVAKLEVRASNDPAISLYRDAGFESLRRVPRYYSDGEDAIVMVIDLDPDANEQ